MPSLISYFLRFSIKTSMSRFLKPGTSVSEWQVNDAGGEGVDPADGGVY
jgi:hypothetical protein